MRIVIATIKSWNLENAVLFREKYSDIHTVRIIGDREGLCPDVLDEFDPDYVFFPHWSYMIPEEIYGRFECVVFHMTDLPFGRGGSPLQNLIVRGFRKTKISAVRVEKELDAGPVYLKREVGLDGSAEEIYRRISEIIFTELIPKIMEGGIEPEAQTGEPVLFRRRTPDQSELKHTLMPEQIYDYIRMLDAEGYPRAFLQWGDYRLVFSGGMFDGRVVKADVEIIKGDS